MYRPSIWLKPYEREVENHNLNRMNKRNTAMLSVSQLDQGRAASSASPLFENTGRFIHAKQVITENQYGAQPA